MSPKHLSEDLLVLARRGALDPNEERQLRLAIEGSVELRLLHEAGSEFDRESPVMPGDEALLERLARRMDRRPLPARSRWRNIATFAVAGVFLAGTVAAGTWVAIGPSLSAPEDSDAAAGSPAPVTSTGAARRPSSPPAGVENDRIPSPESAPESESALPRASQAPEVKAGPRPSSTTSAAVSSSGEAPNPSAELFAEANRARRDGRGAASLALYGQLIEQYPGTAEAQHARLTVGELALQKGDAARALSLFTAYGEGPLAAEALWGRARAYRALGRAHEERFTLKQLVDRFPRAPCSIAARRRLASDNP
jgi:hypothetical protein